ncbi:MAG: DUF1501 domain-containing protein [Victivallales bacterium]|jgi:hypothetical protein|nr:DUF1501 domain-containing protein [Victivallales bacterium]MBT7162121.1 DUF1501 domain-containing protein [Victivallales bacterium]
MSRRSTTDGMTRREALRLGLLGAGGMGLLGQDLLARTARKPAGSRAGRAKSVIQIWMWGGPPHTDTFDPKPDAGKDYTGPLNKTMKTNVTGIRISDQLPLLAKQADKYSIIRSMTHGINGHETASYITQTGRKPGRLVFPCAGAVVSLFKGYDQGYKGIVPPYIVLTQPQGRFSEAGFLGQKYKPFATGGNPAQTPFAVEGIVAKGITDERQLKRRELLHKLDGLGHTMPGNPHFAATDQAEENAYAMMFGDARKLFDLSSEKDALRDRYGRNTFGQSCLMARRLAEQGVPYITINYKGWDTHKQHFDIMSRKLPEMDQGMSTLLEDLADRGLLDSTIVWWGGEFGRGPKVQWNPPWNGGRSHYGKCFSAVVAGGGFEGGQVVGKSSARGEEVVDRPVYPVDMIGSIYELMGIDPEGKMPNPRGLDVQVLPAGGDGIKSGGRLKEIM